MIVLYGEKKWGLASVNRRSSCEGLTEVFAKPRERRIVCAGVGDTEKLCKCVCKRIHVFAFSRNNPAEKPDNCYGDMLSLLS